MFLKPKNKLCILVLLVLSICSCSVRQVQESELLAIFQSIAVSPDSKYIAAGRNIFNVVFIYDAKTLKVIKILKGFHENALEHKFARSLSFSPDGKFLAAAGIDKALVVWNVNSGNIVLHLSELEGAESIDYSPDGSTMAVAGIDGNIRFVDTKKRKVTAILKGHNGRILSVAFSPCGKIIASGGVDKSLRLWHFDSKQQIALFEGHNAPIFRIEFSHTGQHMASASTNEIKLWKIETGKEEREIRGIESIPLDSLDVFLTLTGAVSFAVGGSLSLYSSRDIPISASFSPNERFLAYTIPKISMSGDHIVLILDLKNNKTKLVKKGLYAVAFSPNGKFLAAVGNGIKLINPSTGEVILPDKPK